MPKLNSLGKWCSGVAAAGVSYEGQLIASNAGEARFLDDTHVIYQQCDGPNCQLIVYDTNTSQYSVASTSGANYLEAGGGVWAAWLSGVMRTSTNLSGIEDSSPHDVGFDGAIAIKEVYQSTGPHYVKEKNGQEWDLSSGDIFDVQLLGSQSAIWTDRSDGLPRTRGIAPLPVLMPEGGYAFHMAQVGGKWYVCYANNQGVVIHPAQNATQPRFFHPEHVGMMYNLDFRAYGDRLFYVYSLNQGETTEAIVVGSVLASDVGEGTPGTPGTGGGVGEPGVYVGTGATLTSQATYPIADAGTATIDAPILSLPAWPVQHGRGRLVHPMLGAFDYEVKPDEWVNIDADVVIPPVWASTRTMTGAVNVLWQGYLRDVVVEERWKALGGLAMPIGMMRMLYMIWTNPIDPVVGYVQWWPNYISPLGYKVLPVALSTGGQGLVFDDVVNYLDDRGPDGWVTQPVTFQMKIVERIQV